MFTCAQICVHMDVEARVKHQVSSSITLYINFLRQCFLLNLEFTYLTRLTGQQAPGTLLSPSRHHCDDRQMPMLLPLYVDREDLISDPHAYTVSTLTTEPSPQKVFHGVVERSNLKPASRNFLNVALTAFLPGPPRSVSCHLCLSSSLPPSLATILNGSLFFFLEAWHLIYGTFHLSPLSSLCHPVLPCP